MISESRLAALEAVYSDIDGLRDMGIDEFSDDMLYIVCEMRGLMHEFAFLTNKIIELEALLAAARRTS